VRYRAWQPPSALHPYIGAHGPLVFDIVDTWNKRAIGGCTYHVSHAGGRSYETLPVNAVEAESRRINRFWAMGHTPAKAQFDPGQIPPFAGESGHLVRNFMPNTYAPKTAGIPVEESTNEYPVTLDLRTMN